MAKISLINFYYMKNSKTILVVEDDFNMLKILVDQFTKDGFNVLQSIDGEDGFLIANRDHPDLIILDIILPKMSGLKMMDKLRKGDAWGKNVPIFILTNVSPDEGETLKTVAEDMPSYYIVKADWDMKDIIEKVKERLELTK